MARILTIVVIVIIVLIVIALFASWRSEENTMNSDRRHSRPRPRDHLELLIPKIRDSGHPNGCCSDPDCCAGGDRPHAPRDVCCDSDDLFSATVNWKHSASAVDHYKVYVKYKKHCDDTSSPDSGSQPGSQQWSNHSSSRSGSRSRGSRSGSRGSQSGSRSNSSNSSNSSFNVGHSKGSHHGATCGCNACVIIKEKSCSPDTPKCECGPHNYDRIFKVAGCDNQVRLTNLKVKGICVTVSAVSRCGKESHTANCCTTCIYSKCKVYACITQNDCKGLSLKWEPVHCAKWIRVYYDGIEQFKLPGDSEGVKRLPAIEHPHDHVTLTTENEGGESKHFKVSRACPCKGSRCGECRECKPKKKRDCHRCKKPKQDCGCGGHKESTTRSRSRSRSRSDSGSRSRSNSRSNSSSSSN